MLGRPSERGALSVAWKGSPQMEYWISGPPGTGHGMLWINEQIAFSAETLAFDGSLSLEM